MLSILDQSAYGNAKRLFAQQKFYEAFYVYKKLADDGDAQCKVFLGWMYSQGLGVERSKTKASECYRAAGMIGSAEGAFFYGKAELLAGNHNDGLEWLQRAAKQEYGPALLWLGLANIRGLGVAPDNKRGIEYLTRAARTGNFPARRELAMMMIRGKLGIARIPLGLVVFPYATIAAIVTGLWLGHSHRLIY